LAGIPYNPVGFFLDPKTGFAVKRSSNFLFFLLGGDKEEHSSLQKYRRRAYRGKSGSTHAAGMHVIHLIEEKSQ
jgi:hypothetical protein